MMQKYPTAELVLHGGERFVGYSFGYEASISGEVVFATGMVGYPESLTDPSYKGQLIVLTSPMVGNYGVPAAEDDCFGVTRHFESAGGRIHASAVIVQEYCDMPDHWEMYESLGAWLRAQRVPAMMMVDTRSIVLKLRDMGTALGKLLIAGQDVPFTDPNTRNLVAEVSTTTRQTYGHGTLIILVIDMGVKLNTLRCLLKYDVTLIVVPHDHDITTEVYDGLFISNGPGNPQMCTTTIRNVRWALQQDKPIFGICMGNQMLALAAGGTTYKMKYGHRGQNQPCRCTVDDKVVITTQNHGFAVDYASMPHEDWEAYFVNPNDGSNEGLRHKTKPFYSVQFHPEGRCGPQDTEYLFDEFVQRVKASKMREMAKLKPRKVLVLGAGGIVIAQAGEFDYSGSQCLKALRDEGVQTVLVNPNIATVQTDDEMADAIYFCPLTVDAVERVIAKERPDGIMLAWGGQTALNCGMQLDQQGILRKYNVHVLGTPVSVIACTEDRELFRDALLQIGEHVAKSVAVTTVAEAVAAAATIGFPLMVRAAYTLGGQGSGIVHDEAQLRHTVEVALAASPQVLLEESVAGWKEIEYEVVRDIYDNCITVCNMENVDPMGIHTGESIVVAPSQTLTNDEFHMLRSASIKIIRHLGIIGECNIQYGLHPTSHRYVVIEVNARLSRSSALASKATGYPLAYVAAHVALGKGLFEIVNGVTKNTMACFEPSLDYIVVKVPRWDLDKFNMVSEQIGSMMKSVGEVMAIGRTFEEALQKALRMVDPANSGFDVPAHCDLAKHQRRGSNSFSNLADAMSAATTTTATSTTSEAAAVAAAGSNDGDELQSNASDSMAMATPTVMPFSWDYMRHIRQPTPYRIFAICRALERGHSVDELHELTRITKFFLYKLERLVQLRQATKQHYGDGVASSSTGLAAMPREALLQLKAHGFSDRQIASYVGASADEVRARRVELHVMPLVKQIDTVAGEFPAAQSCYLYTTYNAQYDDVAFVERMYVVLGCGVYRIGNSVEFDYAGVLVARELRRLGNKVIMINYNPETVSTDYDECDRLYFDEVSEETVLDILAKERVRGVVISLGGQVVQNMALKLKEHGLPILGTDPASIDMAEDRNKFSHMCDELGVPQPAWTSATSVRQVLAFCARVGFPVLVRPSYVLSGSAMAVIANEQDVTRYLYEASFVSGKYPVVVSKYYEGATEYDVDIVAHHGRVLCYAICEHVEHAGVHSGDATMFLPPQSTSKDTMKQIYTTVTRISERLDVTGPMNVQLLLTADDPPQLRVIEANVRSSRSVPFVSKTLGISFPAMMVSAFLAQRDHQLVPIKRAKMTHIGCKASVFSFSRLAGADPITGVEMASTGEVGVFGRDKYEVFLNAMQSRDVHVPRKGIFVAIDVDRTTESLCPYLARLARRLPLYASPRTAAVLREFGVPHEVLRIAAEDDEDEEDDDAGGSSGERGGAASTYEDEVVRREKFDLVVQLRDKRKDFVLRRCTHATAPPDYHVRRLAVDYNISLLTEVNLVRLFCEALTANSSSSSASHDDSSSSNNGSSSHADSGTAARGVVAATTAGVSVPALEVEPFRHYVPKIYHKIENNNCAVLRNHKVGLLITNNNASKVLALRLLEEKLDVTCFHAYLGGTNIEHFEVAFKDFGVPIEVVDLRCDIAEAAFDLIACQCQDAEGNWHLSKLAWHIFGKSLLRVMVERRMTVVAQSSKQSKTETGFEKYVHRYAPKMGVYNAWRDTRLMEDFASEADQIAYLRAHGVKATVKNGGEVHNSVCGITHHCASVHELPAPTYVRALRDCSATPEFVALTFRRARCVQVNGVDASPLQALQLANEIAARNGVGVTRTREGAMYEAPGMRLLATSLRFLYDVSFDRATADLFRSYSAHIAQQLALGQYSEKHTQSAVEAVRFLTDDVNGVVEVELHRGEIIFLRLSHVQNAVDRRAAHSLVTEDELEEVFQPGNGSFSDVQW